jgi:hypothetical protein
MGIHGYFCALGLLIGCAHPVTSLHVASAHDLVITQAHWLDGVHLRVKDTIRVPVPVGGQRWTVVMPRGVLRLLTPSDLDDAPPASGWRFEAIATGSGTLTLTGFPPPSPGAPDTPNPPRFTLQVTVQ